jgi:nucleolar protein 4
LEKELRALVVRAVKEKKPSARVHIKQVKVVRDATRTDATGALRSKRYAFVEFEEHEDALLALRALNNNPAIFGEQALRYRQSRAGF